MDFYKKAFGAEVLELMSAPDGKDTMHASIKIGDSILMMGDEKTDQECKSAETLGDTGLAPDKDAAAKNEKLKNTAEHCPRHRTRQVVTTYIRLLKTR